MIEAFGFKRFQIQLVDKRKLSFRRMSIANAKQTIFSNSQYIFAVNIFPCFKVPGVGIHILKVTVVNHFRAFIVIRRIDQIRFFVTRIIPFILYNSNRGISPNYIRKSLNGFSHQNGIFSERSFPKINSITIIGFCFRITTIQCFHVIQGCRLVGTPVHLPFPFADGHKSLGQHFRKRYVVYCFHDISFQVINNRHLRKTIQWNNI